MYCLRVMSRVLSLVCIFALVALATPCCLPDQASFDWALEINMTSSHNNRTMPQETETMSGSAAFHLHKQLFSLQIQSPAPFRHSGVLNLNKQPGVFSALSKERKFCFGARFTGTIGKPWQCVFDNTNIFTKVDGEAGYLLFIPGVVYGPVTMLNDVCLPQSADVETTFSDKSGAWQTTVTANVQLSNVKEKVDASVFEAPCQPDEDNYPPSPIVIPTPDELVSMILSSIAATARPSSSETAPKDDDDVKVDEDDAEDGDNEVKNDEDDDEDGDDVSIVEESESEASKRRKRNVCRVCP